MVRAPTSRQEMEAVTEGVGPLGGERVIKYNVFLTDAFGGRIQAEYLDVPGPPGQIDGINNDDSYRASRHYINRTSITYKASADKDGDISVTSAVDGIESAALRESSLARQIQDKGDRSATIRLIRRLRAEELVKRSRAGDVTPWDNLIPPNTKFFLESVQENREEKVQIIDTFGEWVAFFFGRRPEVYSYSGTLLNAKNHDWKNEFQENYEYFLRGSQAAKNQATIMLQYDDVLVEGYMLNCSIAMRSENDKAVPFQFNMLVMNRSPISPRSILGLRALRSTLMPLEFNLFANMQQALDLTRSSVPDDYETFVLMREYFSGKYVPGAGILSSRPETGKVEASVSTQPGETSGTSESSTYLTPQPSGFSPTISNKISTGLIVPAFQ